MKGPDLSSKVRACICAALPNCVLDPALIDEWAATRGTGQTHPLTGAIAYAIVDVIRSPK
jgi:hypothetical protein